MKERGILIVVSGFSGAGKGTLMKAACARYDNYALSVSATTRAPREGEEDGREYFFVSRDRFTDMIERHELLEFAEYEGNFYGTPGGYVNEMLDAGKDVILEIEVKGASLIKARYPDTVLIFVTPPTIKALRARIEGRGTETREQIEGRLQAAVEEAKYMRDYDYILENDVLDDAVEMLHDIVQAEHARSFRNLKKIKSLTRQLREV